MGSSIKHWNDDHKLTLTFKVFTTYRSQISAKLSSRQSLTLLAPTSSRLRLLFIDAVVGGSCHSSTPSAKGDLFAIMIELPRCHILPPPG
jgi:hypothetical protein